MSGTQAQDLTDLMRRVQTGDRTAFVALFDHFAPRVKAVLMRSGSPEALAEDCAQETLAKVWQKAALYDPARASVSTWIYTIARNRRIDLIRKQRRPEPEDLGWGPEAEPPQADVLALREDTDRLKDALGALPDKQREVIERAFFGDLSHGEISRQTGLPMGTIKSRIRLALDRLRHAMDAPAAGRDAEASDASEPRYRTAARTAEGPDQ